MTLRDPETGSWYKYDVEKATPKWPVIQPAAPVKVEVSEIPPKPARNGLKMSLKCGDTQIGFRVLEDGTTEEFHDQRARSEEHTSELQSRGHLVCRLLLEKKNNDKKHRARTQTRMPGH